MGALVGDSRILPGGSVDDAFAAIEDERDRCVPLQIVSFLDEAHSIYVGRTLGEIAWIRGYVFTVLAQYELPPQCLPYILEQFETGHDAYVVACAAQALRSTSPREGFARYLRQALLTMRQRDQIVDLDKRRGIPGGGNDTTAIDQLLQTAGHLARTDPAVTSMLEQLIADEDLGLSEAFKNRLRSTRASISSSLEPGACCAGAEKWTGLIKLVQANFRRDSLTDLLLEDQEGRECTFGDYSAGRPAVVTFFYTRCDNPGKCSLTISRLAELQRMLSNSNLADRVCLAAFTYDNAYDIPSRLLVYGRNRGFLFGENARFFRVKGDFSRIRRTFALGVNFVGSIVNQHRIELFLLGRDGKPMETLQRLQWEPSEILLALERVLAPAPKRSAKFTTRAGNLLRSLLGLLPLLAVALMPKCPFCFAAWASALGFGSIAASPRAFDWLNIILAISLVAHLLWAIRRARRFQRWTGVWIYVAGIILVLTGAHLEITMLTVTGIVGIGLSGTFSVIKDPAAQL